MALPFQTNCRRFRADVYSQAWGGQGVPAHPDDPAAAGLNQEHRPLGSGSHTILRGHSKPGS